MKILFRKSPDDLGAGKCSFSWRPGGNYIAIAGANQSVQLVDRKGELLDAVQLPGAVISMSWDREGDVLAVLHDKSSQLVLWDITTRSTEQIETSMGAKEMPVFVMWSALSPVLVVGNNNGNLLIYNHRTSRKIPILGKHQRRVTCGAFSSTDLFACGSDDSTISISNIDGDTLNTLACSSEPAAIQFTEMKRTTPERGTQNDILVSAVLGKRILMLVNLSDTENPINLQFQQKYGDIISYSWYHGAYMVLGFEKGFIVCISAHQSEIGQEIFSVQEYKNYLGDIRVSTTFDKVMSVGDHQLKLRELQQMQDLFTMLEVDTEKELTQIDSNSDGQLLAVAGGGGSLSVYLTKMPFMGAAYKDTLALLTNLNEVTVLPEADKANQSVVPLMLEPSVLAVGPFHIAVASNNRVWFYDYVNNVSEPTASFEYLSTVQNILLNEEFAAVLMEGSARMHRIIENEGNEKATTFPEPSRQARLVAAGITDDFFIFTTDSNYVVYFAMDEWAVVNEYRHTSLIRQLFPEPEGVRITFFDERLDTYVYSPVDDSLHKLPPVGSTVHYKAALWETFTIDRDTFVVYDHQNLYVFLLAKNQIDGEGILFIGSTKLPFGHTPLMLSKGIVHCLTPSGRPSGVLLETHKTDTVLDGKTPETIQQLLQQALRLKRWTYAWRICEHTRDVNNWNKFARSAMQNVNVDLAVRIFRHIGEVSMVWALDEVNDMEEKTLVAGHLALLIEDFDAAERNFLNSSQPLEALDMRRDLLHWPKALQLAQKFAKDQIPFISKEYAQQLEFMGDYSTAMQHYTDGILDEEETEEILEHNDVCRSGVARMAIRIGDIRRGIQLASKIEGRAVKKECAMILEQLKQFNDAVQVYEIGQFYDRAAAAALKAKNWSKVNELLPKVRSPKIHAQYGRVMEGEKKYKEAAMAYKNAKDYDNLVRVLLDHLNLADEAVRVVRESRSVEGAKHVAKFFTKLGDHTSAIQFLVLSQCQQEAYQLAEQTGKMEDYAEALGDTATIEQYAQVAEHFATQGSTLLAGIYHFKAGHYSVSMDYLLSLGENHEALRTAIECVAEAGDQGLVHRLTQFLLGETDQIPKDAKYLFRMYVALNMTREAARTAVVIARDEQSRGNYKVARDLLYAMYQDLQEKNIAVPLEMQQSLMLIHSYLIVKNLIRRDETLKAARMLIRVAQNISRFSTHSVSILTSAVVICTKAGLKGAAHRYAVQLMQPENRNRIDAKYRKKIEQLVRKADKPSDGEEPKASCPYCKHPVIETELMCAMCKNTIPYCVITGRHVVAEDFAVCDGCKFPGYFTEFKRLAAIGETCPMCGGNCGQVMPSDWETFIASTRTKKDEL